MSRLPWFRMYTEARTDRKLAALNDREHRIWFDLLCYSAESEPRGSVDYIDPEFVAVELNVNADELDSAISRMVRLRLVERDDTFIYFPAFPDRQYDKPSDSPEARRKRKQRQRERDAERDSHADVTPCHAQRIEDRDKEQTLERDVHRSPVENPAEVRRLIREGLGA